MKEWRLGSYIPNGLLLPHVRANVQALENDNEDSFFVSTKGMFQKQYFLFPDYGLSTSDVEAHRIYSMLVHGSLNLRGASEVRSLGDTVVKQGHLSIDSLLDISCKFTKVGRKNDSHLFQVRGEIRDERGARVQYDSLFETNTPQFECPAVLSNPGQDIQKVPTRNSPEAVYKNQHELDKDWNIPLLKLSPQLYRSATIMLHRSMDAWNTSLHSVLGIEPKQRNQFQEGDKIYTRMKTHLLNETESHSLFGFEYRAIRASDTDKQIINGFCVGNKTEKTAHFDDENKEKETKKPQFKQDDSSGFLKPTNSFKPPTQWKPSS